MLRTKMRLPQGARLLILAAGVVVAFCQVVGTRQPNDAIAYIRVLAAQRCDADALRFQVAGLRLFVPAD